MDLASFWKLIESIDLRELKNGREGPALEPLISALASLEINEIESFHENLAQVLFDIDGIIYADNAGDSGRSDDGFLYVRCYTVARGKDFYSRAKSAPEKMPKSVDQWCESLLYAAQTAWGLKTGSDPMDWDFRTTVSYESGSNRPLWDRPGA